MKKTLYKLKNLSPSLLKAESFFEMEPRTTEWLCLFAKFLSSATKAVARSFGSMRKWSFQRAYFRKHHVIVLSRDQLVAYLDLSLSGMLWIELFNLLQSIMSNYQRIFEDLESLLQHRVHCCYIIQSRFQVTNVQKSRDQEEYPGERRRDLRTSLSFVQLICQTKHIWEQSSNLWFLAWRMEPQSGPSFRIAILGHVMFPRHLDGIDTGLLVSKNRSRKAIPSSTPCW